LGLDKLRQNGQAFSSESHDWMNAMPATRATTIQQRQEMAHLAEEGKPYQAVADQTGVSLWTARKWIRQAKQGGLAALVTPFGRPAIGPMSWFDPLVRYVALRLKCQHPTWGAPYVVKKMGESPSLRHTELPAASTRVSVLGSRTSSTRGRGTPERTTSPLRATPAVSRTVRISSAGIGGG
jgi:hypothetical protein